MNDIMFHVMFLHFRHFAKVVDVKTVFLCGELEKKFYMECPPGTKKCWED